MQALRTTCFARTLDASHSPAVTEPHTTISKQDCHILNSCHRDYIGHGVSPYDASSGVLVLVGRPYGGVGFM